MKASLSNVSLSNRRGAIPMSNFRSPKTLHLHLLFFVGHAGLAYQLIWQRVLFRVFGVNMESVTIVVTPFMLGRGSAALSAAQLAMRRSFAPFF